ncbi:ras-related protein Rab-26 isoform X1 [Gasterosteus aculeatus]|uniref:RAB26, member RAS oncogene family n=1 Tax=Gasterosteus aculeatus aculeatus TaxID=481459 RepID=A0AAQ4P318_GASAC|nr:ras-related protein Rab-26 isoform X1 [Gasterosteus aculeatus aculeatus]
MSRKKAAKGKGSSRSPKASPGGGRTAKGLAAAAAPSSGLVYPSRPSISNSGEFYDIAFKVMLVGDSGVGKTCLLVRFKDGAFLAGSFISTVGIDFRNKVMSIDAVKVKLQIWDTAGQERFRSVTHAYYRDANALLLLYDVTNKASFDNIRERAEVVRVWDAGTSGLAKPWEELEGVGGERDVLAALGVGSAVVVKLEAWLTEIHEYAQQDVVVMLLGNKVDSTHDRMVKREEGEKLAKEFGVPFMETSSKSGLNVDLAFTAVAKELKHRTMKEPDEPKFQLQQYVDKEMRTAGCCRS